MKHITKFVAIISISCEISEFEKILTGPGKLSGVSRNGPQGLSQLYPKSKFLSGRSIIDLHYFCT